MGRTVMRRLADGLKGFRMAWGGGSGIFSQVGWLPSGRLPGAGLDYETLAGDVTRNSIVANCVGWIADNITEPALTVYRVGEKGTLEPDFDHLLVELVRNPNPHYDGDALWQATAISYSAHGNAYWLKIRGDEGRGAVRELWWVPHWQLRPCWGDRYEFISHYEYRVDGEVIRLDPRDVVHFRYGIDPENPRLGMSRLRAVLREVVTDNEASTYWAAVLRNMGIWGAVISPADKEGELPAGTGEVIRRQLRSQHTGERRGEPLILSHPVRVEQAALDPSRLLPESLRFVPEARICGALRIPALVIGLNVGDQTRTFSNFKLARRAAYEDCLMPMGRRFAQTLESQLLPELDGGGGARRRGRRVGWDYTEVAALREDLSAIYERNSVGVVGGWMKVNEARGRAGLPEDEGQDIYLRERPKVLRVHRPEGEGTR